MGAIAVKDETDIWGASGRLIYDLVEFCISLNGDKEYLINFKNQFDWEYNSFNVYELTKSDRAEFISSTTKYIESGEFDKFGYDHQQVVERLEDLVARMEAVQTG
ncbi:MAG: hypothetical protein EOR47_03450 [Mesorhizobium sp.]|uniref:hypothetical protein n=1 Tax=Mesorhizobium sp. TaxID=1871066 RepID=UPI000FE5B0B2|nr:hypothetical protein [Mesorhizobium sp.]RWK52459.1 MAG: hypothetical protein EOR47_03450 [Mesorhizobium sp.]